MLPRGKRAFLNYKNKKKQETTKKLIFHLKGFIYKETEKHSLPATGWIQKAKPLFISQNS